MGEQLMQPVIVTRAQWGARDPDRTIYTTSWASRTGFVTHHSAGSGNPVASTIRAIQDFHMDTRLWGDVGYNFLVTRDGRAWEGRQGTWLAVGAQARGYNTATIGVCVVGNGDRDGTPEARNTVRWLYDEACRRAGRRLDQFGHRDLNQTDCPLDALWAWVHAGMPLSTVEDSDMTPEESRQLFNMDRLLTAVLLDADEVTGLLEHPGDPTPVVYPLRIAQRVKALEAAAVADETRDTATLAAVTALTDLVKAGGGDVDTAAVLARIDEAAAQAGARFTTLTEELAAVRAQLTEAEADRQALQARLAGVPEAVADELHQRTAE